MTIELMRGVNCEINIITFVKTIKQVDGNEYQVMYIDGVESNFKDVQILSVYES